MITYTLNTLQWAREWKGGGTVLNSKKKVSFSMLLDRIRVWLCRWSKIYISNSLYPFDSLMIHMWDALGGAYEEGTNYFRTLCVHPLKSCGLFKATLTLAIIVNKEHQFHMSNLLFISSIYHQIELFPPPPSFFDHV